ncbi:MAG TPA: S-methyl-5-thioribose-1-phosphate isomerase [Methylococcaceae bacterium]|nr:S-methyl-5-thioribose-1-phosphate isomerase [Methylococcaceae bacterium]
MIKNEVKKVYALEWTGDVLKVLDQRVLPETIRYDEYKEAGGVAESIRTMRVRGAPAIGIAAAYGVALSVMQHYSSSSDDWQQKVAEDMQRLADSRPTAVNLFWALQLMQEVLDGNSENLIDKVRQVAEQIHAEDIKANQVMGALGAELLVDAKTVMTHCNAGALATGGYGTALGVIRSAYQRGLDTVYAGETRPWLQGARLTAWELAQDGIPVTLIADSAAAWLMQSGTLDWIIVGADRIAANGDVANKIGTYSLAVLAKQHGVKLMVVAPLSTIDFELTSGAGIILEQRNPNELLAECYSHEDSLVSAWNPVFDVTPASLITAIVTEKGVVMNPADKGLRSLM